MKKIISLVAITLSIVACNNKSEVAKVIQGKVERDEIAVVGKIAGRIDQILVHEGDFVKKGDMLAILDIPEVEAKKGRHKEP